MVQVTPGRADMATPGIVAAFKLPQLIAFLFVNNYVMPVDFGGQIELFSRDSTAIIIRPE